MKAKYTVPLIAFVAKTGLTFKSEYARKLFKQRMMQFLGQYVAVEFSKYSHRGNKRRYYFGAIIPFIHQLPPYQHLTESEIHDMLKVRFNSFEIICAGQKIQVPRATFSKQDFNLEGDFLDKIGTWVQKEFKQTLPDSELYRKQQDIPMDL